MNFPQEVAINERDIARLTNTYKTAYSQILADIEGATDFGVRNRKALLAQIQIILKELDSDSSPIIEKTLEEQYKDGLVQANAQLKASGANIPVGIGFNTIHQEAVAVLASETQLAFAESIQGVNRSAKRLLSQAVREQLTEQLALGKIKGEALRTIKNNLVGLLREEGLSALIDKGGRKWELDRYSEMLIRTKSVEARNTALINRVAEEGYDLAQISAHGASDNCGDWEGVIVSLRGETKGYPTLQDAKSGGCFHPNCRHATNVLVPELAKFTNAYNPNIDTLTGKEFIDDVDVVLKGYKIKHAQIVATKT